MRPILQRASRPVCAFIRRSNAGIKRMGSVFRSRKRRERGDGEKRVKGDKEEKEKEEQMCIKAQDNRVQEQKQLKGQMTGVAKQEKRGCGQEDESDSAQKASNPIVNSNAPIAYSTVKVETHLNTTLTIQIYANKRDGEPCHQILDSSVLATRSKNEILSVKYTASDYMSWAHMYVKMTHQSGCISLSALRRDVAEMLRIESAESIQLRHFGDVLEDEQRAKRALERFGKLPIVARVSDWIRIDITVNDKEIKEKGGNSFIIHFKHGDIEKGEVSMSSIREEIIRYLGQHIYSNSTISAQDVQLLLQGDEVLDPTNALIGLHSAGTYGMRSGSNIVCSVVGSRTCVACMDDKPIGQLPKRITACCTHDGHTCWDCLGAWITSSMDSHGWSGLRCSECPMPMQYIEVKRYAPAETFEQYDRFAAHAILSNMPNFQWCLSPTGCNSGQVHETGSNGPIFRCAHCGYKACVIHNVAWHEGETCGEYDYRTQPWKRSEDEAASVRVVGLISKGCPGCKRRVQKIDGCDHITCLKCRHEFCWVCLGPYKSIRKFGNSSHRSWCRYHSRNLS